MTNDHPDKIHQARQLIISGSIVEAIDLLAGEVAGSEELEKVALQLKARNHRLDLSILKGTISREDENLERNIITDALFYLVKQVEKDRAPAPEKPGPLPRHREEPPKTDPSHDPAMPARPILRHVWPWAAAVTALVFALFLGITWLGKFGHGQISQTEKVVPVAPKTMDLTANITVAPANPDWKLTGMARVSAGGFTSEAQPVPAGGGAVVFRNIPGESVGKPLRLSLENLNFPATIARQSSTVLPKPGGPVDFFVEMKINNFRGKTLRPNLQPAPNIQLEIADGLAKTVSGADGAFEFSLPEIPQKTVRLVLRRGGRVVLDDMVGLDAAVFQEVKVPN